MAGIGSIVLTAGQNLNQIQSFVPVVEEPLLLATAQSAAAAEAGSPMSAAA
jgi:hypothetical protein